MAKGKIKINLKDPNVIAFIVSVAVIVLVMYLWYEQFYRPLTESIGELTVKKEKLEAELMKINALKPQLEKLRQESVILEARLDSLKNIFPDNKEVPRLIRDITTVNRKSNVITTRFTPKPDVVREYYIENKYDVSVAGDYHNLGALFSYFANLQLIVNLANVTITANPSYTSTVSLSGAGGQAGAQMVERQPSVNAMFELTTFSSRR